MGIFKRGFRIEGFTLAELMTTIIIIGILATIAMPMFSRAMEATKAKEAVAALRQIRTGEKVYWVEENAYWASSGSGKTAIQNINNTLRVFLDTRDERNWNYDVVLVGATGVTATATRTDGGYINKTLTIDQDGVLGGSWPLPKPEY